MLNLLIRGMQSLQAREMLQKEARVLQMLKVASCYHTHFYLPFICVDSNSLQQSEVCDRFLPLFRLCHWLIFWGFSHSLVPFLLAT
jgi:hypothetical protein